MGNILFAGFVTFIIRTQRESSYIAFKERLAEVVLNYRDDEDEMRQTLYKFWFEELDAETVSNNLTEFNVVMYDLPIEAIEVLALDIRNQIAVGVLAKHKKPIKNFTVTYSVEWEDDTVGDFCCRPVFQPKERPEISTLLMHDLLKLFQQHFFDSVYDPGLEDLFHPEDSKFDRSKCVELVQLMYDVVNAKPAEERVPYEHALRRIEHLLYLTPEPQLRKKEDQKLTWLDTKGGFNG